MSFFLKKLLSNVGTTLRIIETCVDLLLLFLSFKCHLLFLGRGVVGGLSCLRGRDSSYCLEETKGVVTSLMFQK